MLQLRVHADVLFGDGQVVGGGQPLLFRTVLRIGLHVHAEYFAGDGGDHLVGGYRAVATHRMAAQGEGPLSTHIRIDGDGQRGLVLDADGEVSSRLGGAHVFDDGNEV